MANVATTFRIDPAVKDGLAKLSKLKRRSLNQLANEALREFVAKRTLEVENELEATLAELRAYRKSDPDFERAIAAAAEAEAMADRDPAEGRVVTAGKTTAGRTESVVLDLLDE